MLGYQESDARNLPIRFSIAQYKRVAFSPVEVLLNPELF